MDDMTRILPSNCSKVFIQRDFSDGTAVKFQTKFPAELDGKVKCSAKGRETTIISYLSPRLTSVWMIFDGNVSKGDYMKCCKCTLIAQTVFVTGKYWEIE